MFELFLMNEYATLILLDMLRGVFGTYGWGLPAAWTGTWAIVYLEEFILWWAIPVVSMLWWRAWIKKHPELAEEI